MQTHEELVAHTGQAVQRELVNKETGEVMPVTATAFSEGVVEFTTEQGVFSFENKGDNTFEDATYTVREVTA
jgi:hypothetical protein